MLYIVARGGLQLVLPIGLDSMRFQFQIKHLMVLVFVAAALFATGLPATFLVAAFCYFAFIVGLGMTWGTGVTRMLQDTWTQAEEDRSNLCQIEIVVRTAIGVITGTVTTFGIIFLGVILANMLFCKLF